MKITCPEGHELVIEKEEVVLTGDVMLTSFVARHDDDVVNNCYPSTLDFDRSN